MRYRDVAIHRSGVRAKLAPRREPYWQRVTEAGYLGLRKMGSMSWVARWRDRDGDVTHKALGPLTDSFEYDDAKQEAEKWFQACLMGVVRAGTVEEACREYVKNRRAEKGEKAGDWAESFFAPPKRRKKGNIRAAATVYGTTFGAIPLDELRPIDVERWRNSLVADGTREKNTANRIFRAFKAAMNYAYRNGMVSSDRAWKAVKPFPVADRQRTSYLTIEQRQKLLAECSPALKDLLTGLLHTAARPNELADAKVKDLDTQNKTLSLTSHKGRDGLPRRRDIKLTDAALKFFTRMAESKFPGLPLMSYDKPNEAWQRHVWGRELREAVEAARKNDKDRDAKVPTETVAYTMRHTAISDWLAAGLDIATVAKRAGTSIAMIDLYYHKSIPSTVDEKLAHVKVV